MKLRWPKYVHNSRAGEIVQAARVFMVGDRPDNEGRIGAIVEPENGGLRETFKVGTPARALGVTPGHYVVVYPNGHHVLLSPDDFGAQYKPV